MLHYFNDPNPTLLSFELYPIQYPINCFKLRAKSQYNLKGKTKVSLHVDDGYWVIKSEKLWSYMRFNSLTMALDHCDKNQFFVINI